jgi:hypothetical protein
MASNGQHWMADDTRLAAEYGNLDRDVRAYVDEAHRRECVQDRAYRAGAKRLPLSDGDWHPMCRGRPWPEYALEMHRWGWEAAAQETVRTMRRQSARARARYERELAELAAQRRARRAKLAWKVAAKVAPGPTKRWRRLWLGHSR